MAISTSVNLQLFSIAFPMLIAGISTPLLGMVDTAVVGHLEEPYSLGAVALGVMIFNILFWGAGFLRMGSTALAARALGQKDQGEVQLVLLRGLVFAFLLGLIFIVSQSLIINIASSFIETTAQTAYFTKEYFQVRIWSAHASLANYVLLGWFLGLGRARFNLYLVVSGNLINILLDLYFVITLQMGVSGVALATVIAEYFVFIFGLLIILKQSLFNFRLITIENVLELAAFTKYIKFNRDIFLRTLFLLSCFSFFTISGAKYGELVLAANAVLMNLQAFMAYVLDSVAHAVEALVGKNYFRSRQKELRKILTVSLRWSVASAFAFSLFYLLFGEWVVSLLTDLQPVKETAFLFLIWMVLSPVLSVWSFWLDGVFIGANQAKYMRNSMLFSMLVFFSLYFLLAFWGNHGLWAALMGFMLSRGLSMGYILKRKQLLHPRV